MKKPWYRNENWKDAKEFMAMLCFMLGAMCFGMLLYWLSFIPFPPGTLGP